MRKRKGISHRVVHIWLVVITVIFSGTIIYSTFRLSNTFNRVIDASKQYSDLQNAAHELMNASDYLTEQVQRFTIRGDVRFLNNYFTEAFESKRREEAVTKMATDERADSALEQLSEAMDNSIKLMDTEYYAMKLVVDAKGITDYPDMLRGIKLSEEDAALSPEDKIRKATEVVLNDSYYEQKDRIRSDMQASLDEIDKLAIETEASAYDALDREMKISRTAIVIQALYIFFTLWLTTRLAINPVLNAIERIREDCPIPEKGSNEFRYLANAYNKMFLKNKSSIERLNYQASHDELTGAYNRMGYDYLLSVLDLKNSYMMLLDVDNFKNINDTYGHETGDKILIKLVNILTKVFRDDDCICRIGGDEFVIFMVHSGGMSRRMIESKIGQINDELENTDDGLPSITISVGITNGKDITDTSNIFEKIDEAMYKSKTNGKNTYTFYKVD
ncbi:MAG: diguanylate cyclase [Lachnospiraceae bacterium]|nr:diguanylate cyclase [Lachnospiraceae bacterium]